MVINEYSQLTCSFKTNFARVEILSVQVRHGRGGRQAGRRLHGADRADSEPAALHDLPWQPRVALQLLQLQGIHYSTIKENL